MKNYLFAGVLCFLVIFCSSGEPVQALDIPGPGRPRLEINGVRLLDLSATILSMHCDTGLNRLEVTLKNWDSSAQTFALSDSGPLDPGAHVVLYFGSESQPVKLFEGTIVSLTPHFPEFEPSTITFAATQTPPPRQTNTVQLAYGAGLAQFDPVLTTRSGVIDCTGESAGNPEIQNGTVLSVLHVGQRFSKNYTVTKTIHTFDMTQGYRTRFHGSTSPAPVIRDRTIRGLMPGFQG